MSLHVCFIGFGEAGRSFSESLLQLPEFVISAYDTLYQTEGLDGKTLKLPANAASRLAQRRTAVLRA